MKARVTDVVKAPNSQHLLYVEVEEGKVIKNEKVYTKVDKEKRFNTARNHSSTHLIQKTLQELLSDQVHQAGSKVDEDSFRFDFTYQGKLSDELVLKIETRVNERLEKDVDTKTEIMPLNEAIKLGAMALFEDKYGNNVRVVTIADSIELCGGTHVKNTKDIGKIVILSLENKGSNVYRITGTSSNIIKMLSLEIKPYRDEITKLLEKAKKTLVEAKELNIELDFNFEVNFDELDSYKDIIDIKNNLTILKQKIAKLEKDFMNKKINASLSDLSAFLESAIKINDLSAVVAITNDYEIPVLKQITDEIANRFDKYFILLANIKNNNVNFICKSNSDNFNCGLIIKELSLKCSGNGGGSKNYAQGGGTNIDNLSINLQEIKDYLRSNS